MKITSQNRNLLVSFSSIMAFVVLLFLAYAVPGLAGAALSEYMVLPLSNPLLCFSALLIGCCAGISRRTILFKLPLSFCFGITCGMLLQLNGELSPMIIGIIALAVCCWLISMFLSLTLRFSMLCVGGVLVGLVVSFLTSLMPDSHEYMLFVAYGVNVTTMLLIACGVCATIALSGVSLRLDATELDKTLPIPLNYIT